METSQARLCLHTCRGDRTADFLYQLRHHCKRTDGSAITSALPRCARLSSALQPPPKREPYSDDCSVSLYLSQFVISPAYRIFLGDDFQIGRASCRERV